MKRRIFKRNITDPREPLGPVCPRNRINYRAAMQVYNSDPSPLPHTRHERGGVCVDPGGIQALIAYANFHPELPIDPPA